MPYISGYDPDTDRVKVALVDAQGQEVSVSGGTQYTEGATDASITGNALLWEDADDTLATVSASAPLPVTVVSGGTSGTEFDEDAAHQSGDAGQLVLAVRRDTAAVGSDTDGDYSTLNVDGSGRLHVNVGTSALPTGAATSAKQDDVLTLLGTIDADTSTLAGAVNGTEVQVDIVSLPNEGQQSMAGSISVAIASDQSAVPVAGNLAHDAVDSGGLVGVGLRAIAHGTNPTAVAAADRSAWYANRAGVPFVMGGHPNVVTLAAAYTAAQTDTAIVSVGAGAKIVVTRLTVTCDAANSNQTGYYIGFAAANTPTTTGVVSTHPGVAAGSGLVEGNGAGMLGVGGDAEDLRITCEDPGGAIRVVVTYYTIES